jgi:hypothetical protein
VQQTGLAVSVSHLQQVHAELIAGQTGRGDTPPTTLASNDDYERYIQDHGAPGAR